MGARAESSEERGEAGQLTHWEVVVIAKVRELDIVAKGACVALKGTVQRCCRQEATSLSLVARGATQTALERDVAIVAPHLEAHGHGHAELPVRVESPFKTQTTDPRRDGVGGRRTQDDEGRP
jgi:hypothetical protein